jgi:CRP-like cAMP-binding protein
MSSIQNPHPQSINRILAALPAEEYARLAPHLKRVVMPRGEVLYNAHKPIEHVYFPLDSMVSVVATTRDGSAVEVGVIGREGVTGLSILMGVRESYGEMMVQLPDSALRLEAETLLAEFERGGALQKALLRYTHAMLVMVSQTVACNRLHHISERLARWLLMCRDRAPSDELPLTHEFMAMMLGIRRAGVTETALTLQADGFIRYTRGRITITDRQGLEGYACECYSIVKQEFDRLYN